MKLSARNILQGTISGIITGAVNTEVALTVKGGATLTAIITNASADALGLAAGKEAFAIVKASSVMLGTDLGAAKLSCRNILNGTISSLIEGPVSEEVTIDIGGGMSITAVITRGSAKNLGLAKSSKVCALIKASSVIIGVK